MIDCLRSKVDDDYPRALRDQGVRLRRKEMLELPHILPVAAYAERLHLRGLGEVLQFDPLDGGVNARVLFLLEKTGPMTADGGTFNGGSGFISRNNDDPTAAATIAFMQTAGIARELTVLWNVIPWWNGTIKIATAELREGIECVKELISLLPKLSAVVMVGKKAGRAKPFPESTGLALFTSDRPSPLVKAKYPERWNAIPVEWAKAGKHISERERHIA